MAISLEALASASEFVELQPGECIFREGASAEGVYRLVTGAVALTIGLPIKPTRTSSAEYLFEIVAAGEFFGINFRDETYAVSACAVTAVKLERFPQSEFRKSWESTPLFIQRLVLQAADKFQQMVEINKVNYLASVQERIANTIRILALKFGQLSSNGEVTVDLHLSRRELAQLSGTIDESVARHLSELKRTGLIREEHKRLIVKDMDELLSLIPSLGASTASSNSMVRQGPPLEAAVAN